jgi:hypothetical protein
VRPHINDSSVEIPLTIDVPMQYKELNKKRLSIGFLTIIATWLGCILFAIAFGSDNFGVYIFSLVIAIGVTMFVRYLYFNEKYYKKHYEDMLEHNYKYDCTQVWEIYEIAPKFPICHFKNGSKALFVMFDKDVIVGKDVNTEYYHYEAIANAYQMLSSKGIEFMHIDYMDTVGKDSRFDPVVESMLKTKNQDLQQLLSVIFEYQTFCMSRAYSTYDVYAFYYKYDDAMFKDDIELVIAQFLNANYKRYRILGVDDMRELMKSIYNLNEFSVLHACDSVFRNENSSELVRVIWTERDGIRTVLNKTTEEKEEQKQQNKKTTGHKTGATMQRTSMGGVASPVAPNSPSAQQPAKPTYVSNFANENDAYIYADDDDDIAMNASTDFSSQNVDMYTGDSDYTNQSYNNSNYTNQQYVNSDYTQSVSNQQYANSDYSQSGYAQQGYSQSDYNQSYTQQDYSQSDYNQNYSQQDYAQSGYSQSYTQQDYSQSGYSQQDFTADAYSAQDYSQQAFTVDSYNQQSQVNSGYNNQQPYVNNQQSDADLYDQLDADDFSADDNNYDAADALTFNPNNVKRTDDAFAVNDFNASPQGFTTSGGQETVNNSFSADDFDSDDEELIDLFGDS